MKIIAAVLIGLAVIFIAPYFWASGNLKPLDAAARTEAPGAFVKLDDGLIHYKWSGPESGQIIVLVHGFSTPFFVFNQNAAALAEHGFRVLQFDHFGRGWSDRPAAKYDADFYDRELIQLFDRLGIDEKAGLVGYSMGGIITAEFTARHPERVASLILLAPAGLNTEGPDGFSKWVLNTPVLGEWIFTVFGRSIMLSGPKDDEADLDKSARLQGDLTVQMGYDGYFPALLSTLRYLDMSDRQETFLKLARTNVPVAALYGAEDATVPPTNADALIALLPAAKVSVLQDGDHNFIFKLNKKVNTLLIDFFEPE